MVANPKKLTLEIPTQIGSYRIFIDTCCDFVRNFEPLSGDFKKLSKFKLVIMELLTNAMKHGKTISFLELVLGEDTLMVRKVDNGSRFSFCDAQSGVVYTFPLTGIQYPKQILASFGKNYQLEVLVKDEDFLEFLEAKEIDHLSTVELPENYGLMVIRQCADSFHYYYNVPDGKNTFEVMFNFK